MSEANDVAIANALLKEKVSILEDKLSAQEVSNQNQQKEIQAITELLHVQKNSFEVHLKNHEVQTSIFQETLKDILIGIQELKERQASQTVKLETFLIDTIPEIKGAIKSNEEEIKEIRKEQNKKDEQQSKEIAEVSSKLKVWSTTVATIVGGLIAAAFKFFTS